MTESADQTAPPAPDRLLLAALEPLAAGAEWNYALVEHGLRSASAAVRRVIAAEPHAAHAEREWLERAYAFLHACTDGEPDETREFVLGRIASLIELAAAVAPPGSDAEFDSMLDPDREDGRTKLKFLRVIAASRTGMKRPTDMAEHVPKREGSEDQGMSAASKHLKHLMLAGYLIRERSGREVHYRLSVAGHEAIRKHVKRGGCMPGAVETVVDDVPELWGGWRDNAGVRQAVSVGSDG